MECANETMMIILLMLTEWASKYAIILDPAS